MYFYQIPWSILSTSLISKNYKAEENKTMGENKKIVEKKNLVHVSV